MKVRPDGEGRPAGALFFPLPPLPPQTPQPAPPLQPPAVEVELTASCRCLDPSSSMCSSTTTPLPIKKTSQPTCACWSRGEGSPSSKLHGRTGVAEKKARRHPRRATLVLSDDANAGSGPLTTRRACCSWACAGAHFAGSGDCRGRGRRVAICPSTPPAAPSLLVNRGDALPRAPATSVVSAAGEERLQPGLDSA